MGYHRQFTVKDELEKEATIDCNIFDVIELTSPTAEEMELIFSISEVGASKRIQSFYLVTRTL